MNRTLAYALHLLSLVGFALVCSILDSDAIEFASRYVFWGLAAGSALFGATGYASLRALLARGR